jgi:hypothetical protein
MNDRVSTCVELGLDHYDLENRSFPKIALRISAGRELTKQDILQILAWKHGHLKESSVDTVSDANLAAINEAVKIAREAGRETESLEALQIIHGIGLVTATAILSISYPQEYAVIDWRVLETLNLFPPCIGQKRDKKRDYPSLTAETYIFDYLPKVKAQRDVWGCTLRDTTRTLCGLSVHRHIVGLYERSC